MSKNAPRPSPDDLREMADGCFDPVIRRTLRQLARDIDEEDSPVERPAPIA